MRNKLNLIAIVLCVLLLVFTAGCQSQPEATEPTVPTTTAPLEPSPAELYEDAVDLFSKENNYTFSITATTNRTIGKEVIAEISEQELTILGFGSDTMSATMEETLKIGESSIFIIEQYCAGNAYIVVEDQPFCAEITADQFCDRYVPFVMFDCSLYGDISTEETADSTVLNFRQPNAAETWALPEGAEMTSASGQAVLDASGNLTETTYAITYTYGPTIVEQTIAVTAAEASISNISTNYGADECIQLSADTINTPEMLERTCLYIYETDSMTASSTNTIISQASSVSRTESYEMDYTINNTNLLVKLDSSIDFVDYSQGAAVTSYSQTELFKDNIYTISIDGGEPEAMDLVTTDIMQAYSKNLFVIDIIPLYCIGDVSVTDLGSIYLIEITNSDVLAQTIVSTICSTLYDDPALLNNLASSYQTDTLEYYLAVDKYTGFPTATGLSYSGTHVIEEIPYILTSDMTKDFHLASMSAYESIMDAPDEETIDSTATPLFYHVTGEDGQEMWLLGTIHVGDGRTSNLPQEIYDAFDASAALAVEFDTIAFTEQLKSDTDLQTAIANAYYYMDGSTAKDHLSSELYEIAAKWLKASGNYTSTADYMKPIFWEQAIGNFYISQGYSLTAEHGVDTRLLQRAKNSGKEIIDIESAQSQFDMLSNFTGALQQMLLEETLASSSMEYSAETQSLYEQWCQGDEVTLRQTLSSTNSELTEEEQLLYNEYMDSMIIKRNDAMLDAAKDYLESGRVIFYAVGLGHLLEANGLVDALRDAGYTVTLVEFN